MLKESLCGVWSYRVGEGETTEITVPFSTLPVGTAVCEKKFDLSRPAKEIFIKFSGVTYQGEVSLNGQPLGVMLPYCEYSFDITNKVKPKDNLLSVTLTDTGIAFGPSEGWQNYAGIIRDVDLLYYDGAHIENVFFKSTLKNDFTAAEYAVDVKISGECGWKLRLSRDGKTVAENIVPAGTDSAVGFIDKIEPWSVDSPALYDLTLTLDAPGDDEYSCRVGFRDFRVEGNIFTLNGQPLFLRGVCRHEMVENSGHVPTEAQIRRDFEMIKSAGCNFIRLVHYPHCKRTVELADEYGILISEEPGLWWSDVSVPAVADGSYEVLRRTILRDRSHPSVAFWLCFNECRFTPEFLKKSAEICRENDPTRPVSGANCMSIEDTKKNFDECGFDFFTMHPYSPTFDKAQACAEALTGKPLVFTEWGGYHVYDNPHLLSDFIQNMKRLYRERTPDGPALAGACFWEWSEIYEFNRLGPACVDGVLKEGLVDFYRNKNLIFDAFCEAWNDLPPDEEKFGAEFFAEFGGEPLSGEGGADFSVLRAASETALPEIYTPTKRRVHKIGPKFPSSPRVGMLASPLTAAKDSPVVFSGDAEGDELLIAGGVCTPFGWPIRGAYGEPVAKLIVEFEDAPPQTVSLRNGYELTTLLTTLGPSRIDPRAANSALLAKFHYDLNFENYCVNLITLPLSGKRVRSASVRVQNEHYMLPIYGMCVRKKIK